MTEDNNTLLVGITKIGTTPSVFDKKSKSLFDEVCRDKVGLPVTEDAQVSVFCEAPDSIVKYWSFGMTVDELMKLHTDGSLQTSRFTLKLWSAYADSNEEFFTELNLVT